MKEFFKKFWHFVVIGVLSAAIIAMIIVMCVCMVPKGSKQGEKPEVVTFDAPADVTVEGKTLTWSATEGATNGYTVKINDYELLTGGTSLSLASTSVTAHLNYGENSLSVRVNAVYNKEKSEYSEAVVYDYNLPESVKAFLAALEELGDDVTAEGVEEKIAAVEAAYEAMNEEEKSLEEVKEPTARFESFKERFAAYGVAKEFAAKVEAIVITADDAEDKIAELEGEYTALTSLEKEFAAEAKEKLDAKKTDRAAYLKGVEDAKAEFAALLTAIDGIELEGDAKNEAIIKAVAEKTQYADNVLANAEVKALLDQIEEKDGDAKEAIEASLGSLKTSIETAIGNTTPNETNYTALEAEEGKIEALGAYAQSQFATVFEKSLDTVQEDIYTAKTAMLNTVVETSVSESTATKGDTRKLYLTVQFKNFRGGFVTMTNPPEVTLTQAATGEGNATVVQQLTKSATGEYVAIIKLYAVADITSASYSIGDLADAQNKVIDVTDSLGYNPFFTDTDGTDGYKVAFNETGLVFTIQDGFKTEHPDGKTYLEIYETGAIAKDSEGFLQFNGSPIVGKGGMTSIDISGWGTNDKKIENFNRYLALNFGDYFIDETRSVHFVIYGEATVDGKLSRTSIDAGTVSSAKAFELTELDKFYTIPSTGHRTDANQYGKFKLMIIAEADGMIDDLNAILTSNDKQFQFTVYTDKTKSLQSQFGIRITIKSGNQIVGIVNLAMEQEKYSFDDIKFYWARAYFAEHPEETSKTFTNLSYTANYYVLDSANADVKDLFKQGTTWNLEAPDTVTLTTADRLIALKTTGKNGTVSDNNVWFTTVAVMGMMLDGSGEAGGYNINTMLTENGSSYQIAGNDALKNDFGIRLTINGTLGGEAWEQVLYLELGKTYKLEDLIKLCSAAYYRANPNVSENITASGLTFKACYYVHDKANEDIKDLFKESAEWEVTGLSTSMELNRACVTLNAPAAIRLSDNGWVVIVRDTAPNGSLLTSGAAKYVKYEFYNKETPNTKYTMYLFVNEENHVEFYKEINADGTPKGESFTMLQNTIATDAGAPIGTFITNLKNAFAEEEIDFTGNWIFVDQYIVEGSDQYLYSTSNTTEFLVTGNNMSVVTAE